MMDYGHHGATLKAPTPDLTQIQLLADSETAKVPDLSTSYLVPMLGHKARSASIGVAAAPPGMATLDALHTRVRK